MIMALTGDATLGSPTTELIVEQEEPCPDPNS
jgi:hypothetical protein